MFKGFRLMLNPMRIHLFEIFISRRETTRGRTVGRTLCAEWWADVSNYDRSQQKKSPYDERKRAKVATLKPARAPADNDDDLAG